MKVAIIGTSPVSRAPAPFKDDKWTIWGHAQANQGILPRVDLWFELHSVAALTAIENRVWSEGYLDWLNFQKFDIFMQEEGGGGLVPRAKAFPRDDLIKEFGRNWFSSSAAWIMAYAITKLSKGDTIGLFGIDMAAASEHYSGQRSALYRWMEIAEERGIEVTIPMESCLGMPPPLYGYSEATRMGRKLESRKAELAQRREAIANQLEALKITLAKFDGCIEANEYMLRTFTDGFDYPVEYHKNDDDPPKADDEEKQQ